MTTTQLNLEVLEPRSLLAAIFPTGYEQYMVELINSARANPAAYAASLGIDLNEGLAAGTISTAAKQPLAINPYLTDGAQGHSQWMLDVDQFSHTGAGGTSPTQRMQNAGYVFSGSWTSGENIAYRGTTGTPNVTSYTKIIEEDLFIDSGISGRGHRRNLMNGTFAEVGVGIRTGLYSIYNSVMATQDFAKSGTTMWLTGVAFADTVTADNFYTPGEGLANITIEAIRDGNGLRYSTTTWASGGYALALPKGRYSIMAKGTGLGASQFIPSLNMGTQNMKRDFKVGTVRVAPEIAVRGNNSYVPNNDTTPRTADNTDFGAVALSGGTITKTFAVTNFGNGTLNLTGSPRVVIGGACASDFTVTLQPAASISGESSSTFTIAFDPSAAGLRTATVTIASNDGNEVPFTFTIAGTGQAPAAYSSGGLSSGASGTNASAAIRSTYRANAELGLERIGNGVSPAAKTELTQASAIDFDQYVDLVALGSNRPSGGESLLGLNGHSLYRV
jgi:uncharacterized protein YkwD